VHGGHMRCCSGWELGGQLFDLAMFGDALQKGMTLKFFEEAPAKGINEEHHNRIILFGGEGIQNTFRCSGETARVITGFDKVWVHMLLLICHPELIGLE